MNRRAFFQSSKRVLSHFNFQRDATGYFVMVDMDRFKEINDLYGHPEGDRVLKEAVLAMNAIFGGDGLIGRVGGDEFAILIYIPTTRPLLEGQLQRLMESIQRIRMDNRAISCSIGAQPITPDRTAEDLYRDADNLLYTAKNRGRNQYMIGPVESMVQANTFAARDIEVSTETAEEADQSGDGARGT